MIDLAVWPLIRQTGSFIASGYSNSTLVRESSENKACESGSADNLWKCWPCC